MKTKLYAFILLSIFVFSTAILKGQDWDNNLSIEQKVAKAAIPIQYNNNFQFIDEIARKSDVILIGESSHFDLTTTITKVNLVKYLKNNDFENFGLESVPFLSAFVYSNPTYSEITEEWDIEKLIPFLPLSQEEFHPIIEMIQKKEIMLFGIDKDAGVYDISAIKAILNRYGNSDLVKIDWGKFGDFYPRRFINYGYPDNSPLSETEELELMTMINNFIGYTNILIEEKGNIVDLKAILQWKRIMNTEFTYLKNMVVYGANPTELTTQLTFRNRDSQMSENILWFLDNFQKKISIWTANFHAAKDISQTTFEPYPLLYFSFRSMGENLYNFLGDKMYSLAFTSLNYLNMEGKTINDKPYITGKLETEISKAINFTPYAFINFQELRYKGSFVNQEFESSILMKKNGKWLNMFDGLYYIEKQTTNHSDVN